VSVNVGAISNSTAASSPLPTVALVGYHGGSDTDYVLQFDCNSGRSKVHLLQESNGAIEQDYLTRIGSAIRKEDEEEVEYRIVDELVEVLTMVRAGSRRQPLHKLSTMVCTLRSFHCVFAPSTVAPRSSKSDTWPKRYP
jgi:hypothetical protein